MDLSDTLEDEPIRWNTWTRAHNVHIEGEPKPVPRPLRLCCPAVRPGDRVQVIEDTRVIEGVVVEIYNATVIVRSCITDAQIGRKRALDK